MSQDEPQFDSAEEAGGQTSEIVVDASQLSGSDLANRLQEVSGETRIQLKNCNSSVPGFGCGIAMDQSIVRVENAGDFSFLLNEETSWDVQGNAGQACGHSIASGRILIRKSTKDYLGAFATGGFIVVYGKAGDHCGYGIAGGDLLVRSTVGNFAGSKMRSGVLVLANGAGEQMGQGMVGGEIFVRGDVKSASNDIRSVRLKDADSMRLSLLLARSGMRGATKEFKLYRARG